MLQPKVLNVTPIEDYRLFVEYETGEMKIFDVKPYISGNLFGKLSDPKIFQTVHPRGSTVEWAGGQDIAPHELYELSEEWDPDFTKVTPEERKRIQKAEKSGFIPADEIDWDHLEKYAD